MPMHKPATFLICALATMLLPTPLYAQFAGGGGAGPGAAPRPIPQEFLDQYKVPADGPAVVWIKPPFPDSRRDAYISMDPIARMPGASSSGWPIIPGGMIVQW